MKQRFVHLHTHSHYSLLDGLSKIDPLLDRVKELGMDSIALTDHGNVYGAVELYKKAKAKGVKPIIGAEIYVAFEGMKQERPGVDDTRYHLVLLVKNQEGYENLVKILTAAHLEGYYYKPRVDEEFLSQHANGLVALSACLAGKIPRLLMAKKPQEAKAQAKRYQEIFGPGNFYLEIQRHPHISEQEPVNKGLIAISKETNIPLVATADSHYLRPEDADAQDILMLINTGARADDSERLTLKSDDFSLKSPEDMAELFADVPEAVANTQTIADSCSFEFSLGKTLLPTFSVPSGKTPDQYVRELCEAGLKQRELEHSKEARERMEYELGVIEKTGFASYFLIVQDFVNWAKSNHIVVGPGRGSVGGSLVAFLLNITGVDPLKYNLLFERFLNPERISMPDIDLDFADHRRDEVIAYVTEKYGSDRVAQIITFGTMASRAVIRDVGRALEYEYGYCDKVAKMIPFGHTLEETLKRVPEFKELYDTDNRARRLIDLGKKLEGVARHASTHACGVVIAAESLSNLVPLQHPTQNDQTVVTQYEMHSIEDLGLLKFDFLGLKNLSIIEDTLKRIYAIHGKNIDIEKIPLDDQKVFRLFRQADTVGIFQVECLSGDTIISNTTIKTLYQKQNKKMLESVYVDEGKVHRNHIKGIYKSGKKQLYTLIAENGSYIKASKDHEFLTANGWKKLEELNAGDHILIKQKAKRAIYAECENCKKQLNGWNNGKNRFCYRCSASFYKNPSNPYVKEKISISVKTLYDQGRKTWNKGLNASTNIILKETGKKISEALSGKTLEELWGKERADIFKKQQSLRSKGINNPMFGKRAPHRKGGFRSDLGHYVRSNWEADFARILNFQGILYQYEPRAFNLVRPNGEVLHYTPDFYVPSQNMFYEIKGWMHELDQEKITLFQEQYPSHPLTIISATKFAEFALAYKKLINWECPRIPYKQSFDFVSIREIKRAGVEETYDIRMEAPGNNFVANGFVVHNSDGMRRYLKELKPTEMEDIIAMVALYRPGPMELIPEYIARKQGKKPIEYLHEKLKPILENTQGICIYQEQLMRIARDIAGFSLAEADVLRKAVGKKMESLLLEQKEKFVQGVVNQGIDKRIAQKIWEWMLPFARYGFNRSHSAAYALISYQTAWLKAHYPVEFMSALLTAERNDLDRISSLIDQTRKMQIEVLPPDLNESFSFFSVVPEKSQIRFGLAAIKNVGEGIVEAIIAERKAGGPFVSMNDFISRVRSKDLNKKSLESMIKAGVFDQFTERNRLLSNIDVLLDVSRESQKARMMGQRGLFDATPVGNSISLQLKEAPLALEHDLLLWEKELLGLYVSSHPLKKVQNILERRALSISLLGKRREGSSQRIRIGGIISSIKKILTKSGKPMMFMNLEDLTDKIEVVIFPSIIDRYPALLRENKIVLMEGRVDRKMGEQKFICEGLEEIGV